MLKEQLALCGRCLAMEIIPRAAKQAEIVSRSRPVRRKNRTMGADRHPSDSGHS
jgi:hypothetical protein